MAGAGSYYQEYCDRLIEQVKQAATEVLTDAYKEITKRMMSDVQEIFNRAVDRFYGEYKPTGYNRKESLRNIFELIPDEDGLGFEAGFLPEKMTKFRGSHYVSPEGSGTIGADGRRYRDDLYGQVFQRGWHGGAAGIAPGKVSRYGAHPSPGTPYWRAHFPTDLPKSERTPEQYGHFKYWGREAAVSDISPRNFIFDEVDMYADIWQRIFNEDVAGRLKKLNISLS